eukprot:TRINITY_DN11228_c0_g1_i2.p1 TRINITY_DN11228_c0_g1~~TRINITY_DN11228_c0_g1_i2.p1  ORF type:complete len:251 (+),score=60.14 TRINITY_DN11228_c0_g1_i2:119-871(+)
MATCSFQDPPTIYYTGGQSESKSYKRFVEIKLNFVEDSCTETAKQKLTHAHYAHGMVAIGNKELFVVSGFDHEDNPTKRCERYNFAYEKWLDAASIKSPRGFFGICLFEQQFVYVFGGCTDSDQREMIDSIECYRVLSNNWETVKLLLNQGWKARVGAIACQLDEDSLIIFGGTEAHKEVREGSITALEFLPSSSAMQKVALMEPSEYFQGSTGCVQRNGNFIFVVVNSKCYIYDTEKHLWKTKSFQCKA